MRGELAELAKDELRAWLKRWRWLKEVGMLEEVVSDVARTLRGKRPNG